MTDRTLRLAQRGLVVVAAMAAIATALCGAIGLRSGTGASFGLMFVVACSLAPAVLVWKWPGPRSLGAWLMLVAIFALSYLMAGWPASHELNETSGALLVMLRIDGALIFVVLPVAVFAVAAAERPPAPDSPRARRMRIVVQTVFGIGMAIAVVGLLPGIRTSSWDHTLVERSAGGLPLIVYLIVLLAPGLLVAAAPERRMAALWAVWAIPATGIAALATFQIEYDLVVELWPRAVVKLGLGMVLVLVLAVLPLVAFASRGTPPVEPLPEARLRRG